MTVKIRFKKLHPDAVLPAYAHPGDAGMDVHAVEHTLLVVGKPTLVKTGLVAEIPDGYELQVRSRSGLALKGVQVYNAPGTVDSGYRGEIGVILLAVRGNAYVTDGNGDRLNAYAVHKGDRVAQFVVAQVVRAETEEADDIGASERGTGGFGSTGR